MKNTTADIFFKALLIFSLHIFNTLFSVRSKNFRQKKFGG